MKLLIFTYMGKSQKIKVEGKNHSFNVVCPDESTFARIKEHNLQILEEAAERAKKISREKIAIKVAAILALLIALVVIKLFFT